MINLLGYFDKKFNKDRCKDSKRISFMVAAADENVLILLGASSLRWWLVVGWQKSERVMRDRLNR